MPCKRCNGLVDIVDSTGGIGSGRFKEEYECLECGAKGWISGNAEDNPKNWNRFGGAFQ